MASPRAAHYLHDDMARPTRSTDWGFPRWRGYGGERGTAKVRLCDRHGCDKPGDCPAPKSPNSPERWYFCAEHAGEYNRGWNYFEGLSAEEAAEREAGEIVPAAIVLRGVRSAEIPAFRAVGRFGRRAGAGLGAAVPVAKAHLRGLARRAVAAPAGEAPVVRSGSRACHAVPS